MGKKKAGKKQNKKSSPPKGAKKEKEPNSQKKKIQKAERTFRKYLELKRDFVEEHPTIRKLHEEMANTNDPNERLRIHGQMNTLARSLGLPLETYPSAEIIQPVIAVAPWVPTGFMAVSLEQLSDPTFRRKAERRAVTERYLDSEDIKAASEEMARNEGWIGKSSFVPLSSEEGYTDYDLKSNCWQHLRLSIDVTQPNERLEPLIKEFINASRQALGVSPTRRTVNEMEKQLNVWRLWKTGCDLKHIAREVFGGKTKRSYDTAQKQLKEAARKIAGPDATPESLLEQLGYCLDCPEKASKNDDDLCIRLMQARGLRCMWNEATKGIAKGQAHRLARNDDDSDVIEIGAGCSKCGTRLRICEVARGTCDKCCQGLQENAPTA